MHPKTHKNKYSYISTRYIISRFLLSTEKKKILIKKQPIFVDNLCIYSKKPVINQKNTASIK
jgi:hypothetical protein